MNLVPFIFIKFIIEVCPGDLYEKNDQISHI